MASYRALPSELVKLGLLGEAFEFGAETRYKLGERFYQLLSFMGCAPALKLEPEKDGDIHFCHFRFAEQEQAVFRYLREESRARCPHCRKPSDTVAQVEPLFNKANWACPLCQQVSSIDAINWKHEAGVSQFFIELIDVHPHEVVPTDGLLKELQNISGSSWDYFYTTM